MRPIGHVFNISTDSGQRVITEPKDLGERYRRRHNEIFRGIPQDQVRTAPYNSPGIIKVISGGEVYFSLVEKIQDVQARPILTAHTMVFSLDELIIEELVLHPPTDIEAYRRLGTPSYLHSQGRRIEVIEAAILECVPTIDVSVSAKSRDMNTREISWILGNPHSDVSDSREQFSPEKTVSAFLEGIHPFVSAHLSFAVNFLPSGRFNVTAHQGSVSPPLSPAIRTFRSEADFRAAVEATASEEFFTKTLEEYFQTYYEVVAKITGSHVLDALRVYRDGLRAGSSSTSLTASFIDESIADPQLRERTLQVCDSHRSVITNLPREDREIILRKLDDVSRDRRVSSSVKARASTVAVGLGANPPAQASTRRSGSSLPNRDTGEVHRREISPRPVGEATEAPPAGRRTSRKAPRSSDQKWLEIDDPQTVVRELIGRTDAEVNIKDLVESARRFTQLIIAGGPAIPRGSEYTDMMIAFWEALGKGVDRWLGQQENIDRSFPGFLKRGSKRKEGMRVIAEELIERQPRNSFSLFDDLMHVTEMATYGHVRTRALREISAGYNERIEEIDRINANSASEALEKATRLSEDWRVKRNR